MDLIPLLIESAGWLGSALVIGAFALISNELVNAKSRLYQGMNVAGSLMLIIHTLSHESYPSMVVNVIWLFIGLGALLRKNR